MSVSHVIWQRFLRSDWKSPWKKTKIKISTECQHQFMFDCTLCMWQLKIFLSWQVTKNVDRFIETSKNWCKRELCNQSDKREKAKIYKGKIGHIEDVMKLADIIHHKTVLFTRPKENVDKCCEEKKWDERQYEMRQQVSRWCNIRFDQAKCVRLNGAIWDRMTTRHVQT